MTTKLYGGDKRLFTAAEKIEQYLGLKKTIGGYGSEPTDQIKLRELEADILCNVLPAMLRIFKWVDEQKRELAIEIDRAEKHDLNLSIEDYVFTKIKRKFDGVAR